MIEHIESLRTKLQLNLLANPNVLEQREIKTLGRRSKDHAAAAITNDIGHGRSGRSFLEASDIKPVFESMSATSVWIAEDVRTIARDQSRDVTQTVGVEVRGNCVPQA